MAHSPGMRRMQGPCPIATMKTPRQRKVPDFESDEFSVCGRPDKGAYGEALSVGTGAHAFDQYSDDIGTKDPKRAFELARAWSSGHWYAAPVLALKAKLVGYKPSIRLPEGVIDDGTIREDCRQLVQAAVQEWLRVDTLVATWRRTNPGQVTFVRPEVIDYADAGGIEVFTVTQNIPKAILDSLSPPLRERYQSGRIRFGDSKWQQWNLSNPDHEEGFRVLKRAPRGFGLGLPSIQAVFRALGQSDSMEAGEGQYAFAGRRVLKIHRLGFEPKPNMPASAGAMQYSEKRAKAIYAKAKGRVGGWEQVVPFDYKYEVGWQDQKPYAVDKWTTIADRLRIWAGPVGTILDAKAVNPDVMQMLRAECESIRDELRYFLQEVIRKAYGWSSSPRISFGNACFTSQRLFYELLRYAHTAGPVSGPTLLDTLFGGEAVDLEKERKNYERTNAKDFLPTFDAAHGTQPGACDDAEPNPAQRSGGGRRTGGKPPLSNPGGRTAG